jgi:hypothetical protein
MLTGEEERKDLYTVLQYLTFVLEEIETTGDFMECDKS